MRNTFAAMACAAALLAPAAGWAGGCSGDGCAQIIVKHKKGCVVLKNKGPKPVRIEIASGMMDGASVPPKTGFVPRARAVNAQKQADGHMGKCRPTMDFDYTATVQ